MNPETLDENTSPPSVADRTALDAIGPNDHPLVYTRAEGRWYRFFDHATDAADGDLILEGARAATVGIPGRWKVVTPPTYT